METTCVKCGGQIAESATAGRPKRYCSTACRRAAEHEIRRVNALLAKLEEKVSNARLGFGFSSPGSVENLMSEIARQEARLRELLIEQGED